MTEDLPDQALRTGTAEEAALLLAALSSVGLISEDAERRAGDDATAVEGRDTVERVLGEVAPSAPVATLLRMWQLGEPATGEEATAAFGLPPDRLVEMGLVRDAGDGTFAAEVVLTLHQGRWFACDSSRVRPLPMASNLVMPVGGSSLSLAGCVPSDWLGEAVDVGTGCGIQAILAAPRSDRVVGTDVNRRALSMARFNAWLNGVTNVEFREGSLLEPVAGEQFDVLMANPPFVVSPDSDHLYRDAQGGADEICRALVEQAGPALKPGGIAVSLVNWVRRDEEDPFAAPRSWVAGTGLDAVVLHHFSDDRETYARRWLQSGDVGADAVELARWTEHYKSLNVSSIAMGVVVLHRPLRSGAVPWFGAYAAALSRSNKQKGDHLRQLVALQDFLYGPAAEEAGPAALTARVLRAAEGHEVNRTLTWRDGSYHPSTARTRIGVGFPFSASLDLGTAELLGRCDGRHTLAEVFADLAAELGGDADEMARRAMPSVRKLVSMGFLLPPDVADLPAGAAPQAREPAVVA
ncbi:MAG: methyltransferase [Acidimicrobiales bacterium]